MFFMFACETWWTFLAFLYGRRGKSAAFSGAVVHCRLSHQERPSQKAQQIQTARSRRQSMHTNTFSTGFRAQFATWLCFKMHVVCMIAAAFWLLNPLMSSKINFFDMLLVIRQQKITNADYLFISDIQMCCNVLKKNTILCYARCVCIHEICIISRNEQVELFDLYLLIM